MPGRSPGGRTRRSGLRFPPTPFRRPQVDGHSTSWFFLRYGAVAARRAHNSEVAGASPAAATCHKSAQSAGESWARMMTVSKPVRVSPHTRVRRREAPFKARTLTPGRSRAGRAPRLGPNSATRRLSRLEVRSPAHGVQKVGACLERIEA